MIPQRISLELTSRCNKSCHMCGRRKLERERPDVCDWGDMPIETVHKIAVQIRKGTIVQFHWNGEPLLYERLGTALGYFGHCITGLNTNGTMLMAKAGELIGNIDTLTLSVIEGDHPDLSERQRADAVEFLKLKGGTRPNMVYRLLGNVDPTFWRSLPGLVATRPLHAPHGSVNYAKPVVIPEMGICLDMLTSIAIDRHGHVSHCVRLDPDGLARIGNVNTASLDEIVNSIRNQPWHEHPRQHYINLHVQGRRAEVPLCAKCDFYGCPGVWEYVSAPVEIECSREAPEAKRGPGRPRKELQNG